MERQSQTLLLCMAGIDAEFRRLLDDARALYKEAWVAVSDNYDACVDAFYPSLYLNLGQAYERVGNERESQRFYELASKSGRDTASL